MRHLKIVRHNKLTYLGAEKKTIQIRKIKLLQNFRATH